jgi:hypothetical protein
MAVTVQDKAKVIAEHQRATGDTGSPEVQIALLTARINGLTSMASMIISRAMSKTITRGAVCCGWCRGGASCSTI